METQNNSQLQLSNSKNNTSNQDDKTQIDENDGGLRIQDRLLPIANVTRIMKRALPPNAKISKGAKEALQECVSEFIAFVTSEASDHCLSEKRRTMNGDDIIWAMNSLGFDNYTDIIRLYLYKLRSSDKAAQRRRRRRDDDEEEE